MKKSNLKGLILQIILLVLCAVLCIGVKTFFSPCEHKTESGMWMACHWAGQAVFGISLAMAVNAVMMFIVKDSKIKLGLALSLIPTAIVTALIPNTLINLCMSEQMRCHSVMKPAVIVISALTAIAALIYVILNRNED